jgi:TolB protein
MNSDGSAPLQLPQTITTTNARDDYPAWSPDGKQIAFSRTPPDPGSQPYIWVMNANGSDQKALTTGWAPAWSPDGNQIAFSAASDQPGDGSIKIWVMDMDGSGNKKSLNIGTWGCLPHVVT